MTLHGFTSIKLGSVKVVPFWQLHACSDGSIRLRETVDVVHVNVQLL